MALRSGFFNSINGDRVYHTGHWAEYFASFIGNGVFPNPSNNLQVASNNNMTITIKPGKAWINGYILINDSDYQLSLTPADGVLNRIDRIVARYDTVGREIRLEVKQGTFASSPVAPALQRNADGYELALADVRINAGVISITQANITDTRLNKDLCGIVHGVVEQVDTTTIFNQYQSWIKQEKQRFENDVDDWMTNEQLDFEVWEQQQKSEFDMWFSNIQDILDGNVAANLQNQIEQLQTDFNQLATNFTTHLADDAQDAHLAKNIGLEDAEGKFTATEVEGAMNELFTNVSDGKSLVGGAITGVDDSVVIPTDPTFGDLASAIGGISTGKKWASGTTVYSGGYETKLFEYADGSNKAVKFNYTEVGSIGFNPSFILITGGVGNTIYMYNSDGAYTDTVKTYSNTGNRGGIVSNLKANAGSAYVGESGFCLPVTGSNVSANWIAIE